MTVAPDSLATFCSRCHGSLDVKMGERIVICPFCEMPFQVTGEDGIAAFRTVPILTQEQALVSWRSFLGSSLAIEPKVRRQARISEVFLAYLPFWHLSGEWVELHSRTTRFRKPQNEPGSNQTTWQGPAFDLNEFGLTNVPIQTDQLVPFEKEGIQQEALLFAPQVSAEEVLAIAEEELDRASGGQSSGRLLNTELNLIYFPIWVVRYLANGRAYQVVISGQDGAILYGLAPGSALYRTAALLLGMSIGTILTFSLPALLLRITGDANIPLLGLLVLLGLGFMHLGRRAYERGAEYEARGGSAIGGLPVALASGLPAEARDLLSRIQKKRKRAR